jgi:phosphatidylglycerol:prolipoprotein diacylglycerol transferase
MLFAVIEYPRIDPDLLRLGPLHVRWYGLAYLLGFALAFAALRLMSRKGILRVPAASVGDLVSWLATGVVLGGRTGWWLFYHRSQGAVEPWYEPLAIWHGGMSFHGGLAGVLIALLFWSWRRRAPFWNLADCLALVAPLGLFFGRIANFINAELVGRPTTLPWGMIFPGDSVARHPSQLYEAFLEGPLLLLVLWAAFRARRPRDGQTAALFLICYGLFRFAVEFTRQPDPQLGFIAFGWLTMGQLLSAGLILAGLILWLIRGRQGPARAPEPVATAHPSSVHVSRSGKEFVSHE